MDVPVVKEELIKELEYNKYPEHLHVQDVQETDIGEWHDGHELNFHGANYKKFFPDIHPGPNDLYLENEYRRVRSIMLQQISQNDILKRENKELLAEIEKLKKIKEFLKTVKELTK